MTAGCDYQRCGMARPVSTEPQPWVEKMPVITTRSCVRHNTLPRGWKIISARPVNSSKTPQDPSQAWSDWINCSFLDSVQRFYLSPEGKRFLSLQTAKAWLISTIEAYERSEIIESPRKVRKTISHENQKRDSVIVRNPNNYRSELTENSKRRRKNMAERNPFRNLLRTTLKKNYKVEKSKSKSRKLSIVNNILSQRRKLRTSSGISLNRKCNSRSIISYFKKEEWSERKRWTLICFSL